MPIDIPPIGNGAPPNAQVNNDIVFVGVETVPAKANDVQIAFGTVSPAPGAILEIDAIGDGQGFEVKIVTSSRLPPIEFGVGESLGHFNRQLRDRRLHIDLIGVQNPFSLGLAFSSSLIANWPSGYTQTGVYRHFYSGAVGVPLETVTVDFLVLPLYVLTDVFGGGEAAVPVYVGVAGVIANAAGETFSTILGITFNGVGPKMATGEAFSSAVKNDKRLAAEVKTGEAIQVDLKIESTATHTAVGESVVVTLDVYDLVTASQAVGESLVSSLSAQMTLPSSASVGESQTTDLKTFPASYFTIALSTGESSTSTLSRRASITQNLWEGQSLTLGELVLPARPPISIDLASSESLAVELAVTLGLGTIIVAVGQSVTMSQLDELPVYRFAVGELLSTSISTAVSLPVTFATGEQTSYSLDIRPPALLSASFLTGEDIAGLNVKTRVSSSFHCVLYDGVYVTTTEQTSTTTYDLADPILYVDTLEWRVEINAFEFVDMPPSFQYNKGAGILVTVDLQCRPAFNISFATGESWKLESNSRLMAVNLLAPTAAVYPSEFFYIEPKVNLCYPNVFPDADAFEVELDFAEDSCYADYLFAGQSMAVSISARHQMSLPIGSSETLSFDITENKPWEINAGRAGEMLICHLTTDASLSFYAGTGEGVKATLEEPDARFYTGESLIATLHTTFDVEFLERGCLDNEYRYMKPDGFEDVEKFNTVSVELEPFAHDIKARCF